MQNLHTLAQQSWLFQGGSEERPDSWRLGEAAKCSRRSMELIRQCIYTGQVNKMTSAQQRECLSVAKWFGMAYAAEWLTQYLHGAPPEEVAAALGRPKHWCSEPMPRKGWRLATIHEEFILKLLQSVLRDSDGPGGWGHFSSFLWHSHLFCCQLVVPSMWSPGRSSTLLPI